MSALDFCYEEHKRALRALCRAYSILDDSLVPHDLTPRRNRGGYSRLRSLTRAAQKRPGTVSEGCKPCKLLHW